MTVNIVGSPVRGANFYGRDRFVELVSDKLKSQHVMLSAPRRFGKTSVMYRLMDKPLWDYQIVHIDLEHFSEASQLITEMVTKLAGHSAFTKIIKGMKWLPSEAWKLFSSNVEEVEVVQVKLKIKEKVGSNWQESGEEIFKAVAASDKTIIFFLDELPMMIDRMAKSPAHREEAKTLLRWLRALRQKPEIHNVRFIIAGSIGIGHILNELGEISAINDFEWLRLDPFPQKVAASFIDELAKGEKLTLLPQTKRHLLKLIGTYVPYFIQMMFSEIVKSYRQDEEAITPKKVEQIYQEKILGVDCKTYFDHYYTRLRDYYQPAEEKAAKHILRKIALNGSLKRDLCYQIFKESLNTKAEADRFNAMMTYLESDFYVHYDLLTEAYEFSCKLLRDWWLRHYGMGEA